MNREHRKHGSYLVSDMCHKKHETLATNPPINVYSNSINNRLVFKITD